MEDDPDTGKKHVKIKLVEPIPTSIETWVGSLIHNIRSALDQLDCCLARQNGHTDVSGVYFPFGRTKDIFESHGQQGKIKKLHPSARQCIRRLKPYDGGNKLLFAIHDLDIMDKHTALLPVGTAHIKRIFTNIVISGDSTFELLEIGRQSLEEGAILSACDPGSNIELDYGVSAQ